jgi:hypothetical protein
MPPCSADPQTAYHARFPRWRQIRILKIFDIFLRFEFAARLELERNPPFADRHVIALQAFSEGPLKMA